MAQTGRSEGRERGGARRRGSRWWRAAALPAVLLLLCALFVGPPTHVGFSNGKARWVQLELHTLGESLELLRHDIGRYPTEAEGMALLLVPPEDPAVWQRWNGPYIRAKELPLDPWRQPYHYSAAGPNPQFFTLSSDGAPGGPPNAALRYSPPL
jgi:general secretion pathway protein G